MDIIIVQSFFFE